MDGDASLRVLADDNDPNYVSRGGHKLAGALAAFPQIAVAGRRCLDAGASTGGFTDVLLRAGAAHVVAVDVGYGQLAWSLRSDDRVEIIDRTNVRSLAPDTIGGPADLTVADLSFISLPIVLPALTACTAPDGDLLPMVKPQFEVGRDRLGTGEWCATSGTAPTPSCRWPPWRQVWGGSHRASCAVRCPDRPGTWNSSCGCAEPTAPA